MAQSTLECGGTSPAVAPGGITEGACLAKISIKHHPDPLGIGFPPMASVSGKRREGHVDHVAGYRWNNDRRWQMWKRSGDGSCFREVETQNSGLDLG